MKERVYSIYAKEKADEYIAILDEFSKKDIKYTLLNILVSDENPGDLDVLISKESYKVVCEILSSCGFTYYTQYDTDQYLWNKYIPSVGFVQIHCYLSFSFRRKNYLKGYSFNSKDTNNPVFQFFVFLIESFFKGKRRDSQYEKYLELTNKAEVLDFATKLKNNATKLIHEMLVIYENKQSVYKKKSIIHYLNKGIRKFSRLFNREDKRILFIGVDGAGKSSIVEGVHSVFSKGGVYPQTIYLGLRNSRFNRKQNSVNNIIEESGRDKIEKKSAIVSCIRIVKLLLYWIEYNSKYILYTYIPNSAASIYLIDRCYIDLLRFYKTSFAQWLILKACLYPSKIVFLTGDKNTIFERKKEFSESTFEEIYNFYTRVGIFFERKQSVKYKRVDTTKITLEDSIKEICDYIMG